jgi:hypothetical protein
MFYMKRFSAHVRFQISTKSSLKLRGPKTLGLRAAHRRIEMGRVERLQRTDQALRRLRIEEQPGRTIDHRLHHPPARYAITGRPDAIASSGVMPKSSTPGNTKPRQRRK